jgi:hypothetical protein
MYLPDGYGTVFPYLMVRDAERSLTFLKNVFDAAESGRTVPRHFIPAALHDKIAG